jgi:hypothetical protein
LICETKFRGTIWKSMFSLTNFTQQLAETIAWCLPRISLDDPKNSLRTVLPGSIESIDEYDLMMRLVDSAISIRATLLEAYNRRDKVKGKPVQSLPVGLAGGRLLVFYPEWGAGDPMAKAMTGGFFDEITVPACDTWIYGGIDKTRYDRTYKYLICWIPSQLLTMVDEAIQTDPSECIAWLDKTNIPLSFLDTLQGRGFIV